MSLVLFGETKKCFLKFINASNIDWKYWRWTNEWISNIWMFSFHTQEKKNQSCTLGTVDPRSRFSPDVLLSFSRSYVLKHVDERHHFKDSTLVLDPFSELYNLTAKFILIMNSFNMTNLYKSCMKSYQGQKICHSFQIPISNHQVGFLDTWLWLIWKVQDIFGFKNSIAEDSKWCHKPTIQT